MAGERRIPALGIASVSAIPIEQPQTDNDHDHPEDDHIPINPEGITHNMMVTEMGITGDGPPMMSALTHGSGEWANGLAVGQQVDVLDSTGYWCEAEILKIDRVHRKIYVTFLYWDKSWDDWISDFVERVAPLHTHTYTEGGALKLRQRIEALDKTNKWLEAFVIDVDDAQALVKVHYKGWHVKFDEWLDQHGTRIRPYGRFKQIARKREQKLWRVPGTNDSMGAAPTFGGGLNGVQSSGWNTRLGLGEGVESSSRGGLEYNNNHGLKGQGLSPHHGGGTLGSFSSSKMNTDSSSSSGGGDDDYRHRRGFDGDDPAADGHLHRDGWKRTNHRAAADNFLGHRARDCSSDSVMTMDQSETHQQHRRQIEELSDRYGHYIGALHTHRLKVVTVPGDGNCLFRAVAHQVYGDHELHDLVRQRCLDFMEADAGFFSQFVEGGMEAFPHYLRAKRMSACWGDDPEIQAICELYNRPAEIWAYDPQRGARKLRTFHEAAGRVSSVVPLKLSYYGGGHYDSVVDEKHSDYVLRSAPGEAETTALAALGTRLQLASASAAHLEEARRVTDTAATEQAALDLVLQMSHRDYQEQVEQRSRADAQRFDWHDYDLETCLILSLEESYQAAAVANHHGAYANAAATSSSSNRGAERLRKICAGQEQGLGGGTAMEVTEGGPEMDWGSYELYGDSKGEDGDGNGLLPRYVPLPQSPPVRDKDKGQPSSSGGTGALESRSSAELDAAATTTTTAMDIASSNAGATAAVAGTSSSTHDTSGGGANGGGGASAGQGGVDNGSMGIGESILRAVSEQSEREYLERALLTMVQTTSGSSSSSASTGNGVSIGGGDGVGSAFGGGESEEEMLERAKRESLAAFDHTVGMGIAVPGGVQELPEGPESASLALALKLSDLSEDEALALALRQSHTELQAAAQMGSSLPLPLGASSSSSSSAADNSYESDEAMLQAALTLSMQGAPPAQREYLEQARQLQMLQQQFQTHSNGANTTGANSNNGENVNTGISGGSGGIGSSQAMLDEEEEIRQAIAESLRQHSHP